MLNENEKEKIHNIIKEIIYESGVEETLKPEEILKIDEETIDEVKSKNDEEIKRNYKYTFKDINGKGYYFKHYADANYKRVKTIYNAIEGRRIDILPKIYCKHSDKNGFYIIEEEIVGKTIRKYIDDKCGSISQILEIIKKLCRDIEKFHNLLLVHCDLTPANIIVCKENNEFAVKIIDLENVFLVDAIENYKGKSLGTEGYIADEIVNSPSSIDRRTDIFSIGVILNEWINKTKCLKKYNINITNKVSAIISRCKVEQNKRYNNVTELMQALNEIETIVLLEERLKEIVKYNEKINLISFCGDNKDILSKFHNDKDKKDEILYILYDKRNERSIRFSLDSVCFAKGKIFGINGKKSDAIEKQLSLKDTDEKVIKFYNIIAVEKKEEIKSIRNGILKRETKDIEVEKINILKEISERDTKKLATRAYDIGKFNINLIVSLISNIVEKRKMLYSVESKIEYYKSEYDKIENNQSDKESTALANQLFLGRIIDSIYEKTEKDKRELYEELSNKCYDYADVMKNLYKQKSDPKEKEKCRRETIFAYDEASRYGHPEAEEEKELFISRSSINKDKKEEAVT